MSGVLWAACLAIPAAAQAGTRLGISGTGFTVNGKPTFLLGFSYYGALGAPASTWQTDLDAMQRLGFGWLRVWATWTASGVDVSAVEGDGRLREPYFGRLRALVADCDRRGLVVDITLSRGPKLMTLAEHRNAVEGLVRGLKRWRNWYLDLSNERNIRDTRYTSVDDLAHLRDALKQADPGRLVTASHGGDMDRQDVRAYVVNARLDFLTPHRAREPGTAGQTEERTRTYLQWARAEGRVMPVHYQEPFRRGYGEWQPTAEDFAADLAGARKAGAAGWCFHNGDNRAAPDRRPRRSFDLADGPLIRQLDAEERRFVERASAIW